MPANSLSSACDQVLFGVKTLPRIHGTQQQVGVAFVDAHRFGGEVRPADLDDHVGDFGKGAQALFDPFADLDRIRQRNSRQLARFHQNRSFIEPGHEFSADEKQRSERDRQDKAAPS